ncbi:hypothetical protein HanPI659440_Chr03g0128941 [Helianthus annuus]|nr:hypothetical protein HanPI659440_Chr03g0128941 [Helianthus annuus]
MYYMKNIPLEVYKNITSGLSSYYVLGLFKLFGDVLYDTDLSLLVGSEHLVKSLETHMIRNPYPHCP